MKIEIGPLQGNISRIGVWMRLFGYGVSMKDARRKDLLFSDRNRVGAVVAIGPFLVRLLAPPPPMRHDFP